MSLKNKKIKNTIVAFQNKTGESRGRLVSQGANKQQHSRVPGDRFNEGSPNNVDGDAGPLRERRGSGVRRGVLSRVLAQRQVASLQESQGGPSKFINKHAHASSYVPFSFSFTCFSSPSTVSFFRLWKFIYTQQKESAESLCKDA